MLCDIKSNYPNVTLRILVPMVKYKIVISLKLNPGWVTVIINNAIWNKRKYCEPDDIIMKHFFKI